MVVFIQILRAWSANMIKRIRKKTFLSFTDILVLMNVQI
jgi:hypothetical protein